jgi:opacity protein-like surface antigen
MLPLAASAQTAGQGAYVSIYGGPSFFPDSKITDPAIPSSADLEASLDTGFQIGGAVGYHFNRNFRGELEGYYRRNALDSISASGTAFGIALSNTAAVDGHASNAGVMGNVYWDFANSTKFTPYVGGGIGLSKVDVEISSGGASASDNDTVFAYQAMAGVKYALTSQIAVNVGYRYFATTDPKFGTTEVENQSHNVDIGLTYNF